MLLQDKRLTLETSNRQVSWRPTGYSCRAAKEKLVRDTVAQSKEPQEQLWFLQEIFVEVDLALKLQAQILARFNNCSDSSNYGSR